MDMDRVNRLKLIYKKVSNSFSNNKITIFAEVWKYVSFGVSWAGLFSWVNSSSTSDYYSDEMLRQDYSFIQYCYIIKDGYKETGNWLPYLIFLMFFGAMCHNFLQKKNYIFIIAMTVLFAYAAYAYEVRYMIC